MISAVSWEAECGSKYAHVEISYSLFHRLRSGDYAFQVQREKHEVCCIALASGIVVGGHVCSIGSWRREMPVELLNVCAECRLNALAFLALAMTRMSMAQLECSSRLSDCGLFSKRSTLST